MNNVIGVRFQTIQNVPMVSQFNFPVHVLHTYQYSWQCMCSVLEIFVKNTNELGMNIIECVFYQNQECLRFFLAGNVTFLKFIT